MTFSILGTDTQTNERVELPKTSRPQGLYIIGIQGTGKSGLIENLIMQDIKQQIGVCVLDPHGELIDNVIARLPGKAEDKVIYLDINDYAHPFGLNVFTCPDLTDPFEVQKTIDKVEHIFEKLLGVSTETPLILEYLLRCTQTLIANPGYTMAEIPLLLADSRCRQHLVANVTDTDVLLFWRRFDQMKATEQQVATASTLRRVGRFLQPLTRNIVGQSTTTIDLQDIMNEGKILLVKLSTQVPSVAELIGSVIIALFLNAAPLRPANKRKQFHLYADEFQRFATEDFATLLEEARKFGIGTTIAHQNRSQLDAENKQLETNLKDRSRSVGNLVVFRVNSKDADDLAGEFDITPQEAWEEELEEEWVEVIKEEWHERIEEEIDEAAEEPELIYEKAIVRKLLSQYHPHPAVQDFINSYLKKIDRASKIPPDPYRDRSSSGLISLRMTYPDPSVPDGTRNYPYEHKELQEALEHMDTIFYDAMTGKDIFLNNPAPGHDFELINSGCYYDMIGLLEWFLGYRHYWFMQMGLDEKSRKLGLLYLQKHHDVVSYGKKINWDADAHFRVLCQREDEIKKQMSQNLMSDVVHLNLDLLAVEEKRCKDFMASLKAAAYGLKEYPLQTKESGRYQPRTRKQITYLTHPRETIPHPRVAITHPQRPYQDVRNELATQLVSLPNFTARIRITVEGQRVEHTITTFEPEKGLYGKALQERIDRIRARNVQEKFLRERKDVEAEISQRQFACIGATAPAQPQLPQSPRHARAVPIQGNCPNCGKFNLPGSQFCNQCGTKL